MHFMGNFINILIKIWLFRFALWLPELVWNIKTLKPAHLHQFPSELESLETLRMDSKYLTLRESIEVLHGKKQKLDCIFEQYSL